MASRPVVPQQHRGDAAGNQKNNGAAQGRRALCDIGNVAAVRAVEGKRQPLPHRPVTRSFGAQLLANAQAAAVDNKRPLKIGGPVPDKAGGAKEAERAKPVAKKVTVKPQPETVIEISPDTNEKPKIVKRPSGGSGKKKKTTLSAVLAARSKAACGKIVDIDAVDTDNVLAVVEYIEDIYKFYKLAENETRIHDYMHKQTEVNEKMRGILVDWLIEVHHKFELMPETLYLTINIVDRFLCAKLVSRRELQLVGLGAMLMACKYEEIWAPEVNDFVCISDRAYTNEQILGMEKTILGKLEWELTVPTLYHFLPRFIKAAIPEEEEVEHMAYFLAELAIMNYGTVMYCPSMVAASAVYAARTTLKKSPFWNQTLNVHTGFSEAQVMDCSKLLVGYHSVAAESKLRAVYKKYSKSERKAVALLEPAKALLGTS